MFGLETLKSDNSEFELRSQAVEKRQFQIKIPDDVKSILYILVDAGYDAYVVGGCVRDSYVGIEPHDWDICTSALPRQMQECFAGYHVIETGIKHGTLTIVLNNIGYEITTFRTDGEYSDHRHPSNVGFITSLKEDLARRDFTVNAMAADVDGNIIDYFNGIDDLQNKKIRCVGNADERFQEDALRILRCLRFASRGFSVDHETMLAARKNCGLLRCISAERINSELCKMLMGHDILRVMIEFQDVIATIIPEITPCIGFEQNNKYHMYTIYEHIVHAVANYNGNDIVVRLALLLHDIGKPNSYIENETGGHFHGHGIISRDIAEQVMDRLKFDNKTKHDVLELILYHDSVIEPQKKIVLRWLSKIGTVQFERLMDLRLADIMAHAPLDRDSRIDRRNKLVALYNEILNENECFQLKDLAVNGHDLIKIGYEQGQDIGNILDLLLDMVICDKVENKKDALIEVALNGIENQEGLQ